MKTIFSNTITAGILFLAVIVPACTPSLTQAHSKKSHCEVIISSISFYDPDSAKYLKNQIYGTPHKIWYKDSFVIQEIPGFHLYDSTGTHNPWTDTQHYTFIDLRTKSFFDYSSFSDSAEPIKKYSQADTTPVFGGWNFYAQHHWPRTSEPIPLTDTIIESISYRRIKMILETNNNNQKNETIWIGYLRCDKKSSVFMYDKLLSNKLGCPMIRVDQQPPKEWKLRPVSMQIEFITDTLSHEEEKVFNAWMKNAEMNPVK